MVKLTHPLCVCVSVSVRLNRPTVMFWQGLFKHRLHQQYPSWWYSIAKTSLVHKNKTSRHKLVAIQKPKRCQCQSTLAWNFTAAALYILQHRAFEKREDKNETFEDWSKKLREQTKFPYWSCVLELELSILQFTQSIRTAYQFIQTLTKLLPCCCCCFALDNINYARWLSVYLCDMRELRGTHQCIKPFALVDLLCTSTWAVQCDGKRKWWCNRICQQSRYFEMVGDCWATDCSFAQKLWA